MEQWIVSPDREMLEQGLVLSLLVNGRTVFQECSLTSESLGFAEALKEFGLDFKMVGDQLVTQGVGFGYSVPIVLPLIFSPNANALILGLASKDLETCYSVLANSPEELQEKKQFLLSVAKVFIKEETETSFSFSFQGVPFILRLSKSGSVPYLQRNFALLSALVSGNSLDIEERQAIRDQWTSMLCYFGVNITYNVQIPEFKDEFERRLAKAQGIKMVKTWKTNLLETKTITSREYFIPGDATLASAYALAATLFKEGNRKQNIFSNVVSGGSRGSVFTVLKRMGADLDFQGRHERYGESFGNLLVKPIVGKRLQGCHFSGDSLGAATEEIPILAVAACFAEKETIFHLPASEMQSKHSMMELLAQNLRKAGAEVGVYEDGLVIRGKEEPDMAAFDCGGFPVVGLALSILNALMKNPTEILGIEATDKMFPGARETLSRICSKET